MHGQSQTIQRLHTTTYRAKVYDVCSIKGFFLLKFCHIDGSSSLAMLVFLHKVLQWYSLKKST